VVDLVLVLELLLLLLPLQLADHPLLPRLELLVERLQEVLQVGSRKPLVLERDVQLPVVEKGFAVLDLLVLLLLCLLALLLVLYLLHVRDHVHLDVEH
jgi:hypothetical protein